MVKCSDPSGVDSGAGECTAASYAKTGLMKMARIAQTVKARPRPAHRVSAAVVPSVVLDVHAREPLQRQLYTALRDAIRSARIPAEARLPSTRLLAESLAVSRTTVSLAYEQLCAEGYVRGHERSGTFVNALLPDETLHAERLHAMPNERRVAQRSSLTPRLSSRGESIAPLVVSSSASLGGAPPICFRMGTPALDQFPVALWGRLLGKRWRSLTASQLAYGDPAGLPRLREAIASYARQARAVRCDASQVIVVSGAQQAFDLIARVLLDVGDTAAVEDPGYRGIRAALSAAGARLLPIAVDRDGLDVAALGAHVQRARSQRARMVCVTPSHQFPLGVTMSASRRLALLEWAQTTKGWIVEDDFDSEYRFRGRPLPSLQGMDDGARVLYIGTFSKTLFPALRLGYLIVPSSLVAAFRSARAVVDRHPPALEQSVLADFIAEGHFARHVRRMRALYAERQECLLACLERELGDFLDGERMEAGMHLVAWLRPRIARRMTGMDARIARRMMAIDARIAAAALTRGVAAVALSTLAIGTRPSPALLLGFAAHDEATMRRGVATLRESILSIVGERGSG